jgi:uncharacterized membrane protein YciS (DUF1049 family)
LVLILSAVLIIFVVAFCIPLFDSLVGFYNSFATGQFLASPMTASADLFVFFLYIAFLAVIVSLSYVVIRRYRSNPSEDAG